MDKQDYFLEAAQAIKSFGYRVFIHNNKPGQSPYYYGIFSDGHNVGGFSLSCWWWAGVMLTSKHKPCREAGTGISVIDEITPDKITPELCAECLQFVPNWYKGRKGIVKYKDLDDYLNTNYFGKPDENLVEI